MAQDKKSFLLYCDLIHTIEKIPNEKAGELFKIILQYVNDKNPNVEDLLLQVVFEPIKQSLKRDLVKYYKFIEKQSINGSKGGRPKKPNESQKTQAFLNKPKKADSVSDSDILSKDNNNETPTIEIFLNYAKTLEIYKPNLDYAIKSKYQAWIDNGWKDGNGKIIKNWKTTLRNTMPYLKAIDQPREETDQEYKVRMLRERGFAV